MTVAAAAERLAADLAADAVWHGDRCTWIAPVADPDPPHGVVRATLPADLYAGLAGVGLALAEAAAVTGDRDLGRTARGALRQARAVMDRAPLRGGLFGGATGVALALARAGTVLGAADLADAAAPLALAAAPADGDDLVTGAAGEIVGLLALARATGEAGVAARAHAVAAALARRCAGDPPSEPEAAVRMTGLAHGRAGVALALAEAGFGGAAHRLSAGEDRWFDGARGNWRDLRGHDPGMPSFAGAWCHGAPGIVVARTRMRRLTDGGAPVPDAALGTLRRHLEASLAAEGADRCLCHGVSGLAEAAEEAGIPGPWRRAAAEAVAADLRDGVPPHCGIPGGRSLGLMTGLAGMLHLMLRTVDAGVPGVLPPSPAEWRG